MPTASITSAIKTLSPLLKALEYAYWDASDIALKDRVFDLITRIHIEIDELSKLSVADMEMPYEPITPEFASCCNKLSYFMSNLDTLFPRTVTAAKLTESLPKAASLLNQCSL